MDWEHFKRLAIGCKKEYALASEDGLRLPMNGRLAAAEKPITPVAALQQGLPVLLYVPDSKSFEQRVVKVDNRLTFLYVLVGGAGKEKQSQPIVVGLNQIWSVREGVNALALCEIHDIKDENLTSESAVVVEVGQHRPEQDPPMQDLLIFCTPPKLRLRERILACSAGRNGCASGDKGKQMVVPHMDGVRIKDHKKVWQYVGASSEPADIDVQFLTSSGHPGGKPVTVPMKSTADKIIEKIDKQNSLAPIDRQRIRFVIYETEIMQKWAEYFNTLCNGDFLSWMDAGSEVESHLKQADGDDGLAVSVQPGKDASKQLLQTGSPPVRDVEHQYALLALKSVHMALEQLLDLENERSTMAEADEQWHRDHEERQAAKIKAPSRLIADPELLAGSISGPGSESLRPMAPSDAGSVGRRSIDTNRRSLEPGWDVNQGSPRATSMAAIDQGSARGASMRSRLQPGMVLPEAHTVVNQNIETSLAPSMLNSRSGPNEADVPTNIGRPSMGRPSLGTMGGPSIGSPPVASGAASGQVPSEAHSPRVEDRGRWNVHPNDLDPRAYERGALEKERSKQDRGFFDTWLSSNMPGVAKIVKQEFECGFGR